MATEFSKNSKHDKHEFYCEVCDYTCSRKHHLNQHFLTQSHKKRVVNNVDNSVNNTENYNYFECSNCNKSYKERSGLWKHKKKCMPDISNDNIDLTDTNVILHLIKQNDDFKHLLLEQSKTILDQNNKLFEICKNGTSNTNISNVNSHNKTFNLNVFLNETCKDAMNIMDFVDSIKLQLSDLEKVGKNGYVEGISDIITSNLKALDVTQRPIHCTDKKREVLYIKDENKWEKEDDEKNKLRKAIKRVACKNQRLLPKFKEAHPDCIKAASKFSDQYNKMIIESMGGSGDNDLEKEDKIIKKIVKEVIVNKSIE
jgi:hypothetical protein